MARGKGNALLKGANAMLFENKAYPATHIPGLNRQIVLKISF